MLDWACDHKPRLKRDGKMGHHSQCGRRAPLPQGMGHLPLRGPLAPILLVANLPVGQAARLSPFSQEALLPLASAFAFSFFSPFLWCRNPGSSPVFPAPKRSPASPILGSGSATIVTRNLLPHGVCR